MKVKDIIKIMDNRTEIYIYHVEESCGAQDVSCDDVDCNECQYYWKKRTESTNFRGHAEDCPIKLAECKVYTIDNRAREEIGNRKKKELKYAIAMEVNQKEVLG